MRLKLLFLRSVSLFSPKPPWIHHFHTSGNQEFSISSEVISILAKAKPIEPALEPLVPFLSPEIVTSVIKEQCDRQLGFRFFVWASKRERLRSRESRSLIIDMLSEENGCDLYWQTLEQLKDFGVSVTSYGFFVLISAYAKMGLAEKAVESFGRMKEFDCRPDVFTYNLILQVMMGKEVFLLALAVYSEMLKCNCSPNRFTSSILIDGLCKKGRIDDALKMFDEMTQRGISPNTITYTIILSGLCQMKRVDDAHRLFHKMKDSGCPPDPVSQNALLDGYCKSGRMDEAFALLRLFEKDGFVLGLRGYSSLIDGLFRAKRYSEAYDLYKKMLEKNIEPDIVLYTIVIQGLSRAGKVKDALELLRDMTGRGVVPDTYCYNAVIKGLCEMGLLDQARSLKFEISEHDCFPDVCTYTILICGMCRNGLVTEAQEIFNEMEKQGCSPSVITFNALIDGLCKSGQLDKARLLFYKMEVERHPSLFLRLSHGGNRALDSSSLRTMVEQYCESGLILKAYRILAQLADTGTLPDIVTYNILINGFCKAGNIDGAFKLLKELQLKGLSPDSVTYGTLINGLQRVGREEDAFGVFNLMAKYGCMPSPAVYRSLMTWSCRRRKISMAFSLWMKYLRETCGRTGEELKEIEQCFEKGEVEKAVRGLLQSDIKLSEFSLGPYMIWLIGLCQSGKFKEAMKVFSILDERKIIVTPPSCVKLIYGLCKRGKLDMAVDVFLYTLLNGFKLMPRVCDYLLRSLLLSNGRKELAFELVTRMKLGGYNVDSLLRGKTKQLLRGHRDKRAKSLSYGHRDAVLMESISPG